MQLFQSSVLVLVAIWCSHALVGAQYAPEFLQPLANPPDGVVVSPATYTIRIDENNAAGVVVAEIVYTGTPAPRVTFIGGGPSGQPAPTITIIEVGGRYLVEIGTSFDYEVLAESPIYVVSLTPILPDPTVFFIEIADLNDNPPVLNCEGGLEFEIEENRHEASIHQFTATDEDTVDVGRLRFALQDLDLPGLPELSLFTVDPLTGLFGLKPGVELDYEIRTQHRLVLSVTDSNPEHKVECPVTLVTAVDLPDRPPKWTKFVSQITLEEGRPIEDYQQFQYEAEDQDYGVNDLIEYSLFGVPTNPEGAPYFAIDAQTGIFRVTAELDAEDLDPDGVGFHIDVIATEVHSPYDSVTERVWIRIVDVNDNSPYFENIEGDELRLLFRESAFQDPEDDPDSDWEREIFQFRAWDPDFSTEVLNFSWSALYPLMEELVELVVSPGSGNRATATLRRRQGVPIDREAGDIIPGEDFTNWLAYTVSVSDGLHITSVLVNITVEDINDNVPVFVDPVIYIEIAEDADLGFVVGNFYAVDRDIGPHGTVSFLLNSEFNGGNGTDKFAIDLQTGVLTVREFLDREEQESYRLQVRAIDFYRPETSFGSLWQDLEFTIRLLDVNDNPPRFDPNARLEPVREDEAVEGTDFGVIFAYDDDLGENARLSFTLENVTCSNPAVQDPISMFSIENDPEGGDNPIGVRVRAAWHFLDRWGVYQLQIIAMDNGTPSLWTRGRFELIVDDVNNHAPVFVFPTGNEPRILVSRGLRPGAQLEHYTSGPGEPERVPPCYATDEDDPSTGNGRISYSLVAGGPDDDSWEYFQIGVDGIIRVAQSLGDRESTDFVLTIQASDSGTPEPLSSVATLRLTLVPIFNSPPLFLPPGVAPPIQHWENDRALYELLPLAHDEDIVDDLNVFNETICYYLTTGHETFKLDANNNILMLQDGVTLDREDVDLYELQICARNFAMGWCPPAASCESISGVLNVTVQVEDVNDERPVFEGVDQNGVISGSLSVDADIGSINLTLVAIDRDLNDPVTYRISSSFLASDPSLPLNPTPFNLDRNTGRLDNLFQPQPGMRGYYSFEVTAEDSFEAEPHATVVLVRIHLIQAPFPLN